MNARLGLLAGGFMAALLTGCGGGGASRPDNSGVNAAITGSWESNCYELLDAEGGSLIDYVIDHYDFQESDYTLQSISYQENSCDTETGSSDNYFGTYELHESMTTTDGASATRMTMTLDSLEFPEGMLPVSIEQVYRASTVDLNFGTYEDGGLSTIFYDITYRKD